MLVKDLIDIAKMLPPDAHINVYSDALMDYFEVNALPETETIGKTSGIPCLTLLLGKVVK